MEVINMKKYVKCVRISFITIMDNFFSESRNGEKRKNLGIVLNDMNYCK